MESTLRVNAPANDRIIFVPTGQLRVDPKYQRTLSLPKVRRFAANWDPRKADSITVSARADGFYVLDGQHRLAAARQARIGGLWALVHEGLSVDDEAALFVALNTERTRPKGLQIFKSRLLYDPVAQAINAVAVEEGWDIRVHANSLDAPRQTVSVAALESLWNFGGESLLRRTLQVAGTAWPDDPDNGRADILLAVGNFIRVYQFHPRFDQSRLLAKLQEKPVVSLRQRLRALYSLGSRPGSGNQDKAGMSAILEAYNRGLRGGWLPSLTAGQLVSLSKNGPAFEWPE